MTRPCKIFDGHLHAPFFIFLKAAGRFSDSDVLHLLGLQNFKPSPVIADFGPPRIYFTEDTSWIHVADDWHYSLWHKGRNQTIVEALHKTIPEVPIFACMVGDSDHSFEFSYFASGQLARKYIVDERQCNRSKRMETENFGQLLPAEKPLQEIDDEQEYVLSLATSVGVKISHSPAAIRCYVKDQHAA